MTLRASSGVGRALGGGILFQQCFCVSRLVGRGFYSNRVVGRAFGMSSEAAWAYPGIGLIGRAQDNSGLVGRRIWGSVQVRRGFGASRLVRQRFPTIEQLSSQDGVSMLNELVRPGRGLSNVSVQVFVHSVAGTHVVIVPLHAILIIGLHFVFQFTGNGVTIIGGRGIWMIVESRGLVRRDRGVSLWGNCIQGSVCQRAITAGR